MTSRLPGACVRAFCVVGLVLAPSLLLPSDEPQATEGMVFLSLFAALFVIAEYGAASPSLVEFRSAPPYNRVRFAILFATLLMIAIVCRAHLEPTALSRLVAALAAILGRWMDVAGGPIRTILWLLPEGTTPQQTALVRSVAALALLVGAIGVAAFVVVARMQSWPAAGGPFNIWINLPTFDPSLGADMVRRLHRDGVVNILLGFLLPYLTPPLAWFVGGSFGLSLPESDLLLVWTIALWAFLPVSMFLRGLALRRLALSISTRQKRLLAEESGGDPAFLPA